jgi:hypothetical protein
MNWSSVGHVLQSGLNEGTEISIDEPQLPGVLPDSALVETLARGSFSVVTPPDESSLMRESMLVVVSVTGNADVLLVVREELLWEKNSGEVGAPSR